MTTAESPAAVQDRTEEQASLGRIQSSVKERLDAVTVDMVTAVSHDAPLVAQNATDPAALERLTFHDVTGRPLRTSS